MIAGRTTSHNDWPPCDDCTRPVDPNDTAPSCGGHVLCVPCYDTSDFRCRACGEVRTDLDDPSWLGILADAWRAGRWAS